LKKIMETVPLSAFIEVIDELKANGGEAVKYCYECGRCDTVCPWNRVTTFSIRKIIREAAFGLSEIEREEIWRCTTCGKCPQHCPRDVRQVEDIVSLRRIATDYGVFPPHVRPIVVASSALSAVGNPLGEEREARGDWAKGLSVKTFEEGMEYLYFSCCYTSYDPRLKKIAQTTANLLNKAGVEYGTLSSSESCCGESVRKVGNEAVFKSLARKNIKTYIENGVKKILVSSPHCFHTFRNEYPEFMVSFEVVHTSQLLFQLIQEGRLTPTKEYAKAVTYHDPCYLGRHNGIFEEPREVLNSIPGLELRELAESHENSLCCGMGGGRIWLETASEERFANIRMQQALGIGAEVLATSCPYCISQFEDSRLSLSDSDAIQVKDITEILHEVV
jgi:Fe-S oxidoreductase